MWRIRVKLRKHFSEQQEGQQQGKDRLSARPFSPRISPLSVDWRTRLNCGRVDGSIADEALMRFYGPIQK